MLAIHLFDSDDDGKSWISIGDGEFAHKQLNSRRRAPPKCMMKENEFEKMKDKFKDMDGSWDDKDKMSTWDDKEKWDNMSKDDMREGMEDRHMGGSSSRGQACTCKCSCKEDKGGSMSGRDDERRSGEEGSDRRPMEGEEGERGSDGSQPMEGENGERGSDSRPPMEGENGENGSDNRPPMEGEEGERKPMEEGEEGRLPMDGEGEDRKPNNVKSLKDGDRCMCQ